MSIGSEVSFIGSNPSTLQSETFFGCQSIKTKIDQTMIVGQQLAEKRAFLLKITIPNRSFLPPHTHYQHLFRSDRVKNAAFPFFPPQTSFEMNLLLLLLFIGVTDAFIPHPLLAYGAMATNSRRDLSSLFTCESLGV